jgi:spore maturation protein CgeB
MRIKLFYHSLVSDWNHGNAHFLRGIVQELLARGHRVEVFEPRGAWSLRNLLVDHGEAAIEAFRAAYPGLSSEAYDLGEAFVERALADADLVIVHEWNDPELIRLVGEHRARHRYLLFFHDTHHRVVSQPEEMQRFDLRHYDGVLAFGEVLRRMYVERGFAPRAFTWHEAADTRVFYPRASEQKRGAVWIGNWGDDERTRELAEYLFDPIERLGLPATVHGVRYPEAALTMLRRASIRYAGWLPNHRAPEIFARHLFTVHVPRRPYVEALVGVPTIRVFEALACGIPLLSAPWEDAEALFATGEDFLVARDGREMQALMRSLLHDGSLRESLARRGLATILARHTCGHRVEELMSICRAVRGASFAGAEALGELRLTGQGGPA